MSQMTDNIINYGQNINLQLENVSSLPSSPKTGRLVFLTTDFTFYGFNGTTWVALGGSGGSGSYYYIGSSETVKIPSGQVMNLLMTLRLDGTIMLDGAIADDKVETL